MSEGSRRSSRRLAVAEEAPNERRPLLSRLYTDHGENGDPIYSCRTDPHSHLPVYTNIHRIRRDITAVVEDYLSLQQLTDVKINVTVVRPLVDKFYNLEDISIVYCLLVNRAKFLDEQAHLSNRQNVNWTRATLCELIATRILRRFNEDYEGSEGLLLLAHILVAGFEPFKNAPPHIRQQAEETTSWTYQRTLPSLEVAILTESKHFLSSTTCQKVINAIYDGRVIYTPSTYWDIIPDHYKLKPISLYEPRESPLLNQYRLIVPRTRTILEAMQFTILLALYVAVMIERKKGEVTILEAIFAIYAFGWGLDQFATLSAHGWNVYTQNLWSFLDVAFISIYIVYLLLRIHGIRTGQLNPSEQAYDVLALGAPVVIPRLAFTLLPDNLVFLSLRSMMADFFALTALSAWCFFGFMLALLWLGEGAHPVVTISEWMIYIWFGLDGVGIRRSSEFHEILGPAVMVAFAFLGNTLFLTILVSMLSNTFSNISSNAVAEMQFRRAVITLEGVKADAVFAYQPPFNILAVFLFLPLKFIVSPRWFHKIHVATVKALNLPVLLIIAVAERRILWGSHQRVVKTSKSAAFWRTWRFSAGHSIRAVFEVPPPDDIVDNIAADDDMTKHLIRRQFTRQHTNEFMRPKANNLTRQNTNEFMRPKGNDMARQNTNEFSRPKGNDLTRQNTNELTRPKGSDLTRQNTNEIKPPSRRDSMFPGIRKRLRGSFSETEDYEGLTSRLEDMEKTMARLEKMLESLLPAPSEEGTEDEDEEDEGDEGDEGDDEDLGGSSTLKGSDGFTVESSFKGTQ